MAQLSDKRSMSYTSANLRNIKIRIYMEEKQEDGKQEMKRKQEYFKKGRDGRQSCGNDT